MTSGAWVRAGACANAALEKRTAKKKNLGSTSISGDGHVADQDRAGRAAAADQHVAADGGDPLEHVAQVAGDGDFLHGIADLAALDPIARSAARVIAGHHVHAVSEQLGD